MFFNIGKISREYETTLEPGKYTIIIENQNLGRIEKAHTFSYGTQELKMSFKDSEILPIAQQQVQPPLKPAIKRPGSARPVSAS